jgi:hypothetical protein
VKCKRRRLEAADISDRKSSLTRRDCTTPNLDRRQRTDAPTWLRCRPKVVQKFSQQHSTSKVIAISYLRSVVVVAERDHHVIVVVRRQDLHNGGVSELKVL